jgi:hypothetical protein
MRAADPSRAAHRHAGRHPPNRVRALARTPAVWTFGTPADHWASVDTARRITLLASGLTCGASHGQPGHAEGAGHDAATTTDVPLVDTNVLFDLFTNDPIWADWSTRQLRVPSVQEALIINALAGKAFQSYRARGGTRTRVLPDFVIGAHAVVEGIGLLTRDVRRYRSYFPRITLITPGDA